jgi:hypothetical protein
MTPEMLDPKINTLLNIITDNRSMGDNNRDHRWCTAYNYLLDGLIYHRPARTMLGFGRSSFRRSTKLSWARRIAWLRRYCGAHDVQLARRSQSAFTEWSRNVARKASLAAYYLERLDP